MNYYQYQTVLGLLTICEENDCHQCGTLFRE